MNRHTPGPWIPLKGIFWSVENEDGYRIASLVESENIGLPSNDDSQANAKLIAAAPDLLEALDRLTKWAEVMAEAQTCEHTGDHPISGARKALIKALTGESQ